MTETRAEYGSSGVITLELELPPSANRLYVMSRTKYGQRVLTPEQCAYRQVVGWAVKEQTTLEQRERLPERLAVQILVYRARHRDLDNLLKSLLDALAGVLHFDDRGIDWLSVLRHDHAEMPPCVVRLWRAPRLEAIWRSELGTSPTSAS